MRELEESSATVLLPLEESYKNSESRITTSAGIS